MRWGKMSVVAGAALIASGCAIISRSPGRQCSDTLSNAVGTFLAGVAEFNLRMIRAVIPDGISPFAVFGSGDAGRGRAIVGQMLDHPEIHRGNEVDSTYRLLDVTDTSKVNTKEVHVERHDQVLLMRERAEIIRIIEQRSRRTFTVAFDLERNCILAVNPVEPEWIRIQ